MKTIKEQVTERLIRYAKINTSSDPHAGTYPTSERQKDLAFVLIEELKNLGADEVDFDEDKCILYYRINSNLPEGRD